MSSIGAKPIQPVDLVGSRIAQAGAAAARNQHGRGSLGQREMTTNHACSGPGRKLEQALPARVDVACAPNAELAVRQEHHGGKAGDEWPRAAQRTPAPGSKPRRPAPRPMGWMWPRLRWKQSRGRQASLRRSRQQPPSPKPPRPADHPLASVPSHPSRFMPAPRQPPVCQAECILGRLHNAACQQKARRAIRDQAGPLALPRSGALLLSTPPTSWAMRCHANPR